MMSKYDIERWLRYLWIWISFHKFQKFANRGHSQNAVAECRPIRVRVMLEVFFLFDSAFSQLKINKSSDWLHPHLSPQS